MSKDPTLGQGRSPSDAGSSISIAFWLAVPLIAVDFLLGVLTLIFFVVNSLIALGPTANDYADLDSYLTWRRLWIATGMILGACAGGFLAWSGRNGHAWRLAAGFAVLAASLIAFLAS